MKPIIICLVDDKEPARMANSRALKKFLGAAEIQVEPIKPFQTFGEYDVLLANPDVWAFFIDQKMSGGGLVNYNGTELAEYLRGHNRKLPIYILTGFANEKAQFAGSEYRVEDILDKDDIEDPTSGKGKILQARILRRLPVFNDVLNEREQRFHDLLVKSLHEKLTSEEEKEIGLLETERVIPQQAKEIGDIKTLEAAIAQLRKRIHSDELPME